MAARSDAKLVLQRQIGAYEIRRLVGRGATASVFECRHVALGRLVAIKVLHPHLACETVATLRFLREGRALSRMAHPNIVEVLDAGEDDGLPYLVMALIDGVNLREHLHSHGCMSVTETVDCLLPVISGVAAAHEAGVVHRDLKPSNICLARDHLGKLSPKVLDFGISKLTNEGQSAELTDTCGTLGTASYMAPEQLRSAKRVDARSDIYSLGVVLYECATGRRPFDGTSGYDLMHAILTAPVPPPRSVRPELPQSFDTAVLRAMQHAPSKRFVSARALGQALAPLASDPARWLKEFAPRLGVTATLDRPPTTDLGDPMFTLISGLDGSARSRNFPVSIVVAAAVACAGFAGIFSIRTQSGQEPLEASSGRPTQALVVKTVASAPFVASIVPAEAHHSEDAMPVSADVPGRVIEHRMNPSQSPSLRGGRVAKQDATPHAEAIREQVGTNGAPILE